MDNEFEIMREKLHAIEKHDKPIQKLNAKLIELLKSNPKIQFHDQYSRESYYQFMCTDSRFAVYIYTIIPSEHPDFIPHKCFVDHDTEGKYHKQCTINTVIKAIKERKIL